MNTFPRITGYPLKRARMPHKSSQFPSGMSVRAKHYKGAVTCESKPSNEIAGHDIPFHIRDEFMTDREGFTR